MHPAFSINLKPCVNVTCHGCGKTIFLWKLTGYFIENTILLNDHLLLGVVMPTRAFHQLPREEQSAKEKQRLSEYCR